MLRLQIISFFWLINYMESFKTGPAYLIAIYLFLQYPRFRYNSEKKTLKNCQDDIYKLFKMAPKFWGKLYVNLLYSMISFFNKWLNSHKGCGSNSLFNNVTKFRNLNLNLKGVFAKMKGSIGWRRIKFDMDHRLFYVDHFKSITKTWLNIQKYWSVDGSSSLNDFPLHIIWK